VRTRYLALDAVVASARLHGEADVVVTLLAPIAGLVVGVAKNGARSQRRFMGALAPATRIRALLARRQWAWYLEEAVVERDHAVLKGQVQLYALSCYALEGIRATHLEGPGSAGAFPMVVELLDHLDRGAADLPLTRLVWDLRLSAALGLAPHLDGCVACGSAAAPLAFDAPAGGLLCRAHAAEHPAARPVAGAVIAFARELAGGPLPRTDGARTAARIRRAARDLVDRHLAWHLPLRLGSRRVLEQLASARA
jgi:DNA repair protein RecO (recombination protein O)